MDSADAGGPAELHGYLGHAEHGHGTCAGADAGAVHAPPAGPAPAARAVPLDVHHLLLIEVRTSL